MTGFEWHLLTLFFGIGLGLGIGTTGTNYKWTNNAKDYKRLEYRGRLYKVMYADLEGDGQPWI